MDNFLYLSLKHAVGTCKNSPNQAIITGTNNLSFIVKCGNHIPESSFLNLQNLYTVTSSEQYMSGIHS